MKKLLLIALVSTICLFSCSTDDSSDEMNDEVENPSTDISDLIGNWKFTSSTLDGTEVSLTPCGDSEIVQFSEDNIYTTEDLILEGNECVLSQLITATYEVSENQITLTNSNNALFENYTFEFNIVDDVLSLSSAVAGYEVVSFFTKTTDTLSSETVEDSSNETPEIAGRWKLQSILDENGIEQIEECEKNSIYIFNEDGTGSYEYVLTIEGDNPYCAVDGEGSFTYTVEEDELFAVDEDGPVETLIFSIDSNILTVTYPDGWVDKFIETTDPLFSEL